jgi:hypothetical protein
MSDDTNKNEKKTFFRINTKGEISEASQPEEKTQLGNEPQHISDATTEVKSKQNEPQFSTEEPSFNAASDPQFIEPAQEKSELNQITSLENNDVKEDFPPAPIPSEENQETLRNYIAFKEKESADLKEQQKQYQQVLLKLKRTHAELSQTNHELQVQLQDAQTSEALLKKEMLSLRDKFETEIATLKNDFEQQKLKNGTFQEHIAEINRQKSLWKEKISEDLKRIKLKEKELENRYELLKKDTETLLDSKDQQILEFRKKNDALELELESLEERLLNEHAILNSIESKKRRLIETLKLAISLLEQIDGTNDPNEERKAG